MCIKMIYYINKIIERRNIFVEENYLMYGAVIRRLDRHDIEIQRLKESISSISIILDRITDTLECLTVERGDDK